MHHISTVIVLIAFIIGTYAIYLKIKGVRFSIYHHRGDLQDDHEEYYYIECFVNRLVFSNIESITIRHTNTTIIDTIPLDEKSIHKNTFRHIFRIKDDEYHKLMQYSKENNIRHFDVYAINVFGKTKKYAMPATEALEQKRERA